MAGTIAAKSDASTTLGNLYYETGPGGSGIVLGSVILWGTQDSPTNVTSSAGLPVAQQGTWSVRVQDGSGNALTSALRGSERALSVQLVDGSGTQITSFGGGTEYTEDAAAAANPVGGMMMAVRRDSLSASEVSADGDNVALKATSKGQLHVAVSDGVTADTELPAAAALADGASNPTAPAVGAFSLAWNGSTWDRVPGNTGGVYLQGNVASAASDAGNPVKIGGKIATSVPSAGTNGNRVDAYFDARGRLGVALGVAGTDVGAGSPADGLATPSALHAGAYGMVYNGTTWDRQRSGGVTGMAGVSGDTAHDAVDAGNPIKVGGKANSSSPSAVSAGDRVEAWYTLTGKSVAALCTTSSVGVTGATLTVAGVFDFADASKGLPVVTYLYNGVTHDAPRNNTEATVFASAARATATNSSDLVNFNGRGVQVVINITAVAGSPSLTFTIKGKDSISGNYYTLLASAALTTTGTTVLTVYPGVTAAANAAASMVLPRTWRVEVAVGSADSVTYSVSAVTIL